MIYNFYAFGRGRKLLCREEWHRTRPCRDVEEESKYVSGLLITLKSFCQQLGPPRTEAFLAYATSQYKLHSFETVSGYRFVLTTDPSVPDQQESLIHIYQLFVDHVIKNPLYHLGDDLHKCPVFTTKLHSFLLNRPFFASLAS
ncbi:unnamed protein product [Effrenium voratum]|uniref:Trafficking protein particle complex subunit n=1 Tax=Effrenium voratum TaxID=2562239 RepID=A0AA36HRI5_9DINO|nr:unnamed protein product [Effrenium voratum]CAJ1441103.1 unnamed protein product [Effrenium voratum]|mmetsp:Transcript_128275/g.304606  ORF Transcript_128275/g.304606 Transcript_128275/m.304606 type:complete len:143 (+) Transcript_128275:62-490(+)